MIQFVGEDISILYYELLKKSIELEIEYSDSRNGKVKDLGPAFIEIFNDGFRLPILPKRALNPFFALAEYSWMITGDNKLEPLRFFISNFGKFSDDDETLNGAYGYRLRRKFDIDQIESAIRILRDNPSSRRVMLSMWSVEDLGSDSKDIPCNTSVMLKVRDDKLDLTVINRSNDLFLGIPYNIFVFYLLQCYLAKEIGCQIGRQRHYTDSLHLYEEHESSVKEILASTTVEHINKNIERYGKYDISGYLFIDHKEVLELNFEGLDNLYYKNLFLLYKSFKETKQIDQIIPNLPKDLLGLACYLWFSEYSGVSTTKEF